MKKNNALKKHKFYGLVFNSMMLLSNLCIISACDKPASVPTSTPRMENPRSQVEFFHQNEKKLREKRPLVGLFVDKNSTATAPDGKSWDKAFPTIMEAVNASTGQDIYVAAGTYTGLIDLTDKTNIRLMGGYKAGDEFEKENLSFTDDQMVILDGESNGESLVQIVGKANNIAIVGGFFFKNVLNRPAVYVHGTVDDPIKDISIVNCRFEDNANNFAGGGGIAALDAENLRFDNLEAENNSSDEEGGFIYANNIKNLTIQGGIWQNNAATKAGGALFLEKIDGLDLAGVRIEKNKARYGGGVMLLSSNRGKINDLSFVDNVGSEGKEGNGAGMYIGGSHNFALDGLSFAGNNHGGADDSNGGALFIGNSNNLTIQFENNKINENNSAFEGAAIYAEESQNLNIVNGIFNNSKGSGMFFRDIDGLTITGTEINKAEIADVTGSPAAGMNIYSPSGKVSLDRVKITECEGRFGAGIYLNGQGAKSVSITNSEFSKNLATGKHGGAFMARDIDYPVTIKNTLFAENKTQDFGGALALDARNAKARFIIDEGTQFIKNRSEKDYGGGAIYIVFDDNLVAEDPEPPEKRQLVFYNQPSDLKDNSAGSGLDGQFLLVGNKDIAKTYASGESPFHDRRFMEDVDGNTRLRFFIAYSDDKADKTARWNQIGLDFESKTLQAYTW